MYEYTKLFFSINLIIALNLFSLSFSLKFFDNTDILSIAIPTLSNLAHWMDGEEAVRAQGDDGSGDDCCNDDGGDDCGSDDGNGDDDGYDDGA